MLYEMLTPDFYHKDDRGNLVQLVHSGYRQINVLRSNAGTFRGGHYHKENHEAFYIVEGMCEVTFVKGKLLETKTFSTGDFFRIGPYTSHAFHYLRDTVMIGMYDLGVEKGNGEKDIFSEESDTSRQNRQEDQP